MFPGPRKFSGIEQRLAQTKPGELILRKLLHHLLIPRHRIVHRAQITDAQA
jgi:hypothetical protein